MKLSRRSLAVIALSAAALAAVTLASVAAASSQPRHAVIAAQPQYDYDDPSRSFLVELDFGSSAAVLVDASVGLQRSYSHLGDPPLLQLSLTDEDGASAGTFNAWDPRWYFEETAGGAEQLVVRTGPGTLTFPFDADTASMVVRDLQAATNLVTVDLRPAVHEFCLAHPSDPECVEADLAITSTSGPSDALGILGQPVTMHVDAVVANLGPDGPVDADVTQTASGSSGITITPTNQTFDVDALAVNIPSTVRGDFDVTCTTLGLQTMTVTTTVVPDKAKVADLNATNDSKSVTFTVDCAVPVSVNVMPGSLTNPVAISFGVLPVAVLTTAAGEYGNPLPFAAATIQAATVRVGEHDALIATGAGGSELHDRVHLEDSLELDEQTRDGDRDGVLHARRDLLGIGPGTVEICVRGRFGPGAGTAFFGCDHVTLGPLSEFLAHLW